MGVSDDGRPLGARPLPLHRHHVRADHVARRILRQPEAQPEPRVGRPGLGQRHLHPRPLHRPAGGVPVLLGERHRARGGPRRRRRDGQEAQQGGAQPVEGAAAPSRPRHGTLHHHGWAGGWAGGSPDGRERACGAAPRGPSRGAGRTQELLLLYNDTPTRSLLRCSEGWGEGGPRRADGGFALLYMLCICIVRVLPNEDGGAPLEKSPGPQSGRMTSGCVRV